MGSQKTKTKSQETATTTPNIYPGGQGALDSYLGGVTNFLNTPAQNYVTPINPLQQMVFDRAAGMQPASFDNAKDTLFSAQQGLTGAQGAALPGAPTLATAGVQKASLPSQYAPATVGNIGYGNVAQASVGALPDATKVDMAGAIGNVQAAGYGGADVLPYVEQFQNPYMNQVVDATMADLGNTQAADRASYARQGAMNNAFGGSRYGIGETNLIDQQGRTRATVGANLRSDAYNNALQAAIQQAGLKNSAGIASMESGNSLAGQLAGYRSQGAIADANNSNSFKLAGFDAANDTSRFNAGSYNDALKSIYGERNTNARTDAGARNNALAQFYDAGVQNNQFNAGQANQAGQFNAGQANDMSGLVYGTTAQNNQFNAGLDMERAQALADLGMNQAQIAQMQQSGQLAQLGLQGDIGNSLWNYQNQAAQAPITQLAAGSELLGLLPQFSGQTINTSGTSTSKQSGGLMGSILGGMFGLGSAYLGR